MSRKSFTCRILPQPSSATRFRGQAADEVRANSAGGARCSVRRVRERAEWAAVSRGRLVYYRGAAGVVKAAAAQSVFALQLQARRRGELECAVRGLLVQRHQQAAHARGVALVRGGGDLDQDSGPQVARRDESCSLPPSPSTLTHIQPFLPRLIIFTRSPDLHRQLALVIAGEVLPHLQLHRPHPQHHLSPARARTRATARARSSWLTLTAR